MNGTASKKRELSKRDKNPSTYRRIVTGTVDSAIVFNGEIWLELDDANAVHLKKGDVVVFKI